MIRSLSLAFLVAGVVAGGEAIGQSDFRDAARAIDSSIVEVTPIFGGEERRGPNRFRMRMERGEFVVPNQPFEIVRGDDLGATIGVAVLPDLIIVANPDIPTKDVRIRTADRQSLEGEIIARDRVTGLAAIRVAEGKLTPISLASDSPAAGLPALVTTINASGERIHRAMMVAAEQSSAASRLGFLAVLDSAFTRDLAGASVVDAEGRLIGIVARSTTTERGDDLAKAFASAQVRRLIQAASQSSPADLQRGMIGVVLDGGKSTKIQSVEPGSPGEQAGLNAGDFVRRIDGLEVHSGRDIVAAVAMSRAGDTIRMEIEREGETMEVTFELPPSADQSMPTFTADADFLRNAFEFADGKLVPVRPAAPIPPIPPSAPPRTVPPRSSVPPDADSRTLPSPDLATPPQIELRGLEIERSSLEKAVRELERAVQQQAEAIERMNQAGESRQELKELIERLRADLLDK